MKIVRFLDDAGSVAFGCQQSDDTVTRLQGDIFGDFADSQTPVNVGKLLAPIEPTDFYCIGQNYAQHAKEGGMPIPQNPCVFMKSSSAVQHPLDPIVLPRRLRSDEVDYECELAVVIGKSCKNVSRQEAPKLRAGLHVC